MKENVTQFDINAAFRALDELEYPAVSARANRNSNSLNEHFTRKQNSEVLIEDYYDINDTEKMEDAHSEREAEIAKAKLARIEKIVDLDAETEDDILPSYIGKYIIQCPQCMQMFYKDEADVVKSEEDQETVNVGEVCQHCGNDQGYTLVGKVGAVAEDEMTNYDQADLELPAEEEAPAEEAPAEEPKEETKEAPAEEENADLSLEPVPEEEEEKKEESFVKPTGKSLNESVESDLNLRHSFASIKNILDCIMADDYSNELDEAGIYDELVFEDEYGMAITDAFYDDTGRSELSYEEACAEYGKDNVDNQLRVADKYFDRLCEITGCCNESLKESEDNLTVYDIGTDDNDYIGQVKAHNEDEAYEIACKVWPEYISNGHYLDKVNMIVFGEADNADPESLKDFEFYEKRKHEGLKEAVDSDLNKKLKDHNEYIAALQAEIEKEEKAAASSKNEFIKKMHEDNLESLKAALDKAIPEEVKEVEQVEELPAADEVPDEAIEGEKPEEVKESLTEATCPKCGKELKANEKPCKNCKKDIEEAQCKYYKVINHPDSDMKELNEKLNQTQIDSIKALDIFKDLDDDEANKVYNMYVKLKAADAETVTDKTFNAQDMADYIEGMGGVGVFALECGKLPAGRLSISTDSRSSTLPLKLAQQDPILMQAIHKYVDDNNLLLFPEESNTDLDYIIAIFDAYYENDEVAQNISQVEKYYTKLLSNSKNESLTEDEDLPTEVSAADVNKLMNSKEFKTPISDEEVEDYLGEKFNFNKLEDIDEKSVDKYMTEYYNKVYSNVAAFKTTGCKTKGRKLVIEGVVKFKSGKSKTTVFEFLHKKRGLNNTQILEGFNKDIADKKAFTVKCSVNNNALVVESLRYQYSINNSLVEGLIK